MTSIPGSGHNNPPRDWLDVLRALIKKLRGLYQEIVRRAVQFFSSEALVRRVDGRLADDLRLVENAQMLSDEDMHALARARAEVKKAAP